MQSGKKIMAVKHISVINEFIVQKNMMHLMRENMKK